MASPTKFKQNLNKNLTTYFNEPSVISSKRNYKPIQNWPFDSRPVRIVNLGFPKTGTSSLRQQFDNLLGKEHVSHWGNCWDKDLGLENKPGFCQRKNMCGRMFHHSNLDKNHDLFHHIRDDVQIYAELDCVSRKNFYFPHVLYLDRFFKEGEGKTLFVLTTRPTSKWLSSVKRWNSLGARIETHLRKGVCESFGFKPSSKSISRDELLGEFKEWHEQRVNRYAVEYNTTLLVFDLDKSETLDANFKKAYRLLTGKNVTDLEYEWRNKRGP